jgi:nucleoside phosphorylase/CheY-like chemotaxis protein
MIRILVLEDEQEKRRIVTEALLEVDGLEEHDIEHSISAVDAKRKLKESFYDLLILDINVPIRTTQKVKVGGGLDVLRSVREALPGIIAPGYIIGLTAYDTGFESALEDFENPLWKLIRFDSASVAWRKQLKAASEYLIASKRPPYRTDGSTFHSTLGIVVGLEGVELDSIKALDGSFEQVHVAHDPIRYFKGRFESATASLDVVVAAAPRMGMPVSAVVATKLIESFRPRYLAMSGICAGVKSKTKIGDILVADPCWDWGSGKITSTKSGKDEFLEAPYHWRLNTDLRNRIKDLADDQEFLDHLHAAWPHRKPKASPGVKIDAVATGGSVIGREAAMQAIRRQHKNLIGIEMEIYAVLMAGELASHPRPTCFAMKAVCDFGDEAKRDFAHRYAAYTSASFLKEFALRYLSSSSD